jgi:hypothetical protein
MQKCTGDDEDEFHPAGESDDAPVPVPAAPKRTASAPPKAVKRKESPPSSAPPAKIAAHAPASGHRASATSGDRAPAPGHHRALGQILAKAIGENRAPGGADNAVELDDETLQYLGLGGAAAATTTTATTAAPTTVTSKSDATALAAKVECARCSGARPHSASDGWTVFLDGCECPMPGTHERHADNRCVYVVVFVCNGETTFDVRCKAHGERWTSARFTAPTVLLNFLRKYYSA